MLRRLLRRHPWLVVTLGCLLVIVIVMDAGRRSVEFPNHRSKYSNSKAQMPSSILRENQTYGFANSIQY